MNLTLLMSAAAMVWAEPQVILLTGSQNPKGPAGFANVILKIGKNGGVSDEVEVAPSEDHTLFVDVSFETRQILLHSLYNRAVVIDLDTATIAKTCTLPTTPDGFGQIGEWVADVPGLGVSLVEEFSGESSSAVKYRAMTTSARVACAESFREVPESDLKNFLTAGDAGIAGTASNESTPAFIVDDGQVVYLRRLYLGYQLPPADRPGPKGFFRIAVNNGQMFVGTVAYVSGEANHLVVFRKRDKKWISLQVPGDTSYTARAFGSYLVTPEMRNRSEAYRESAGKEEWRAAASRTGVGVADAISHFSHVYPGRLHIFDIDTEKRFTIETMQADSEVLLIQAGTIYYRASDRLYSVAINGDSLGTPKLLATNELIRDAHWAFMTR